MIADLLILLALVFVIGAALGPILGWREARGRLALASLGSSLASIIARVL